MLLIQLPMVPVSMFEARVLRISQMLLCIAGMLSGAWRCIHSDSSRAAQMLEVGELAEGSRQRPAQLVLKRTPTTGILIIRTRVRSRQYPALTHYVPMPRSDRAL
jgi:hypothetical protein